ncbi:quinon protein alcohol dehydrogenase-like superfamily [Gymnopilus junonius]|uniref:Quinon protein alcohol dehydrogenase-like superfamily n=1 Tax=Gymnopilus junonius TaxID=109634 RepID=A0A9P5TUP8_GYMJU|nr:quinon protein alcohol dehydrogenase-like superfamily [Gymnopilus junonius]
MAASTSKRDTSDVHNLKPTSKPKQNKGKGKENKFGSTSTPTTTGESWPSCWEDSTPWNWTCFTDPSSSRIEPIFTRDGNYFFSLVGSSVKIHSTTTGLVVSTLSAPPLADANAHTDILTSAAINPQNAFQLITASLDGRLLIWDYANATLLQTIEVGQPIRCMCLHEQLKGYVFIAASKSRQKVNPNGEFYNNAVILKISLKHSGKSNQPAEIVPVGKTRFPTGLAISPNGAWLIATAGHKVYVAKMASLSSGFTKYVSPERLTCVAFHPLEEYFATGDEKGVIRLWYCLNDNLAVNVRGVEKRTQTRSLHWHAHAVSSVKFTSNGAYLLSGGEESVLVIWQLYTGKKEFVPRLGAPISTISISRSNHGEVEYLIGLADATYTFISSSSLKVTRSYSRIKIDPSLSQDSTSTPKHDAPIAVQHRNSTLILPSSHASSLQMYSLSNSSIISELEVSPSNRISRRDDKPIIPAIVEKVVVSESGQWMATVDAREGDSAFRSEVYLKIWFWDTRQDNWVLNTRIDRPHGNDKVVDICFNPSVMDPKTAYLITTGGDGRIKLWKLAHYRTGRGESYSWVSYLTLTFRAESPGSISWSPDASLFAVSVGPHIVLYNPTSGVLRQTLTAPQFQKIASVHFVGSIGRYLLAAGPKSLYVWDLIRNSVSWQSNTPFWIKKIVPHQMDATFAVFHSLGLNQDSEESLTKVAVFRVSSSIPILVRHVPFGLRNVVWAPFHNHPGYNLFGVTDTWRVVMIGDSEPKFNNENLTAARGMNFDTQAPRKTLFHDIFGAAAFASLSTESIHLPHPQGMEKGNHEFFSDAVYMSPSLDVLFDAVAKTVLTSRPPEPICSMEDPGDLIEEDSEVDHEADIFKHRAPRTPISGEMDIFTKLFRAHSLIGLFLSYFIIASADFLKMSHGLRRQTRN